MKFLFLLALLCHQSLAQGEYNYLIASYNYAVAIGHNFEDAAVYYFQYLSQELEKINDRLIERVVAELDVHTGDPALGMIIPDCVGPATLSIQTQLNKVNNQMLVLIGEGNKMHQAINTKMMEVNMMLLPMDEFYFNFTNRMLLVYLRLNDDILPTLMEEIAALIEIGDAAYENLNSCLSQRASLL